MDETHDWNWIGTLDPIASGVRVDDNGMGRWMKCVASQLTG